MTWELSVDLRPDLDAPEPIFLRIARALSSDIRRGRLRPGAELPGSRALAQALGVHRNTVLAAYRELTSEGWIESQTTRGTFVSATLPESKPHRLAPAPAARAAMPSRAGFDLGPPLDPYARPRPPKGTLALYGGAPDLTLVPIAELSRAYRKALRSEGRALLDYGDPRGHERLRSALATMVSTVRGVAASPASVLVTRGSQMALDLCARALLAPGDVVAVESLGYRPAWEALRLAGARLVPIPVDGSGLQVEALESLCRRERVRAVYVTPHHQYPTTVVLSPGRRLALLALCKRERIAILEDDYDHEFHYEGRPVLPLASADEAGVVVYVGTLSKILAPGLRIGFVVAPEPLVERLAALRTFVDRQGDQATERAVAELLEDDVVQRHARRARRLYRARREALASALREHLGQALSFDLPAGGMALWCCAAPGIDVDAWAERAARESVLVHTSRRFLFAPPPIGDAGASGRRGSQSPPAAFRLGFACLDEDALREAVRRLAQSLPALPPTKKHRSPSRTKA